jgi:NADH oxidase (H2O2-forming)
VKVCIIGTGDAGGIAAFQIRRLAKEADIDVFTKRVELGCPPCEIPLVLSGAVARWEDLIRGFRDKSSFEKRNINVHLNTEVTDILRQEKCIIAEGKRYPYDKLMLAVGATPSIPPVPGLDGKNEFALGDIIPKYTSAAIIGAGFIALEIAAALKSRGYGEIYVVARRGIMRAYLDKDMAERLESVLRENGIELVLDAKIDSITSDKGKKRVSLSDRELEVDFVVFATGAKPNVQLAQKAGLQIGETGAIFVNRHLQTSDPDIYAVGDCMENWDIITGSKRQHQLATNAIRTGYMASRNIVLANPFVYEGTVMPFITKLFGHQVGSVGFTERFAREKGLDVVSVSVTTPRLRQRFDNKPAHYKLIAERSTQALVGAQVISEEIVSGTIDKLAVAIANRMPLAKLVQIDSCYSPNVQEDQIAVPLHRLIDELS